MPTTRGPLPPAVYWRRRALVLGTVLALVLVVVNLVRGDHDPPPARDAAVQASGQPSEAPAGRKGKGRKNRPAAGQPTTVPLPDSGYTPAAQPSAEPAPPDPEGDCVDADVQVMPSVPGAVARRSTTIRLSLETLVAEACTWRLSSDSLAVTILDDGGDEVWSSRECPRMVPTAEVVVRRDSTATFDLTWNGRMSTPECPAGQPWAEPADYDVQVAAYGAEPADPLTFTLTDPADVAVADGPVGPAVPGADQSDQGEKKKTKKKKDRAGTNRAGTNGAGTNGDRDRARG
ncbi:hypothetical protein [Nocardioides dongxiaopingii]|uniref:hypothetical protein n=1 Tax=Nocardioides dongxiaopingii TaxID=2576036 RepID=UPI0010C76D6B|nr:hypothetical protein [Nocardioides dongxiaopingii]